MPSMREEKGICELNNAQQMSAENEMSVEKKCWMRSEKGC